MFFYLIEKAQKTIDIEVEYCKQIIVDDYCDYEYEPL